MSRYTGATPRLTDWRRLARCARRQYARTNFFPKPSNEHGITTAQQICAGCPVRDACLDDALNAEGGRQVTYRHGIRGGLTPSERRREYEKRRKAAQQAQEAAT